MSEFRSELIRNFSGTPRVPKNSKSVWTLSGFFTIIFSKISNYKFLHVILKEILKNSWCRWLQRIFPTCKSIVADKEILKSFFALWFVHNPSTANFPCLGPNKLGKVTNQNSRRSTANIEIHQNFLSILTRILEKFWLEESNGIIIQVLTAPYISISNDVRWSKGSRILQDFRSVHAVSSYKNHS